MLKLRCGLQLLEKNSINLRRVSYNSFTASRRTKSSSEFLKWALLVIPVGSFGLGCWQVRRREWKLNLIKTVTEKTNGEPINLPEDLAELADLEYTPVKVRGHFIHEKEIHIGPRAYIENGGVTRSNGSLMSNPKKNQGWLIITPFELHDRPETILINRGWVPKQMKNPETRKPGQIEGELDLIGIVRSHEKRPQFMPTNNPSKGHWYYRDLNQMAQVVNSEPIWLDVKGIDDMPDGWPLPNQTRVTYRNEHLSYLITWFSLSGITSFMWIRQFVQKLPLL